VSIGSISIPEPRDLADGRAGRDAGRRGARIAVQRGRLRAGLAPSRTSAEPRVRADDPEEAEVLTWCRVQVRQMLREGWTRAQLAEVGISVPFLRRLGLPWADGGAGEAEATDRSRPAGPPP
jgi:hypothetical protein